jgi:hypothetical protein
VSGAVLIRATRWIDRTWCLRFADGFAVALAAALPWSTSAATILSVLWLIVVIPTLEPARLRRIVAAPAGGLPVLFFAILLVGTLWAAGVPMAERLDGLKAGCKLLFIPLLIAHFMRSGRGAAVMVGFIVSCALLLAVSAFSILLPAATPVSLSRGGIGVPVHDYITQSGEFTVCAFLLGVVGLEAWRRGQRGAAITCALLGAAFLLDLFVITTSRTALVVLPVLLLLFAARYFSRTGMIAIVAGAAVLGALALAAAPQVRNSVTGLLGEVRNYRPEAIGTRAGERIEFWTKSVAFIADAPLIGHGTGSIRDQFRHASVGSNRFSMQTMVSSNPHNQVFATAIQLGLLGAAVLLAMWFAHLRLFCRGGLAAWAGLVVVTQNIVGSLFNSHLFDFIQGWGYVIGVGVAAGMLMKEKEEVGLKDPPRSAPAP